MEIIDHEVTSLKALVGNLDAVSALEQQPDSLC